MFKKNIFHKSKSNFLLAPKREEFKHLIFLHVPRTGGSSIWHALAKIAASQGIPVLDLYHDAKIKYNDTSKTVEAISDIQKYIRAQKCLIHHHTDIKINNYFDETPCYATVVRDPYDRFISDVIHHVRFARSSPNSNVHIGADPGIKKVFYDTSIDIPSVIDICSRSLHYQNFYRIWFGNLFLGRNGLGDDEYIKNIYDPLFPVHVLNVLSKISCFTNLERAFSDISETFGLDCNNKKISHINKKTIDLKQEIKRSNYLHLFENDYKFLEAIGLSFLK